jgi:hypothetical protein
MKRLWRHRVGMVALMGLCVAVAFGDSDAKRIRARLRGFNEVPSISTVASGDFEAKINREETELSYDLEYSGLEGTVTQSHVHIGQTGVNGGIMFFLCGTASSPGPTGTPVCPASGKVSGVITAARVIGPDGQGIEAGAFAEALRAIRAGFAYANVHSTKWTGGEIRGQIRGDDHD